MTNAEEINDQGTFIGLARLTRMVFLGEDISHLTSLAAYNPDDANMLMGLSMIFQLTGNRGMGLELQGKALQIRQLYHLPANTNQAAIRLLAIMRPGDMQDNTPLDFLIDGSDVSLDMLYMSLDLPLPAMLPDHDVLIVAIAQSENNQPLLERVGELINKSPSPIINRPDRIACLSRDGVSALLRSIHGVEIPIAARITRQELQLLSERRKSITTILEDGCFPIIVRPIDSHSGKGLAKIDTPEDIESYLDAMHEDEFFIARFVDYRGLDGLYRKIRIALIDGRPFVCHLAISENWMIHYVNAGMSESIKKRAEEEWFMTHFDEDFAYRHKESFHMIAERLGLDYLVIDCAETPGGDLLIFEADNTGLVHAMDPVDIFPYKQPQMRKVFEAFHAMLMKAKCRGENDALPTPRGHK